MTVVILSHPYFLLTTFSKAEAVVGSAGAAGQLCAPVGMPLRRWDSAQAIWTQLHGAAGNEESGCSPPRDSPHYMKCYRLTKGAAVACFLR